MYPTTQPLALRLLAAFKAHHPAIRVHGMAAAALYGTGAFVDEASALCEGVQVLSQIPGASALPVLVRGAHAPDQSCLPMSFR